MAKFKRDRQLGYKTSKEIRKLAKPSKHESGYLKGMEDACEKARLEQVEKEAAVV